MASFMARPGFPAATYQNSVTAYNAASSDPAAWLDPAAPQLRDNNLAVPHRYPWTGIRGAVHAASTGKTAPLLKLHDAFLQGAHGQRNEMTSTGASDPDLVAHLDTHISELTKAHARIASGASATQGDWFEHAKLLNRFASNVQGLGPHRGTNIPTSNRLALHAVQVPRLNLSGLAPAPEYVLTPHSRAMMNAVGSGTPRGNALLSYTQGGYATTPGRTRVKSLDGTDAPISQFPDPQDRNLLHKVPINPIN